VIYTIGYSKWTVEQVRQAMDERGIDVLVDVRSSPYGRFSKGFNRPELIRAFGERYLWKGDTLGGKPGPATDEGMSWLMAQHERGVSLIVLCVEWDPRKCHRLTDIAFRLLSEGIDAVHLLHDGTEHTTRYYLDAQ
jgi:uncharacterized protein (DUF488 family)